jgi:hypothetical protein
VELWLSLRPSGGTQKQELSPAAIALALPKTTFQESSTMTVLAAAAEADVAAAAADAYVAAAESVEAAEVKGHGVWPWTCC